MQPIDHLIAAALTGDREYVGALLRADPTLLEARNAFGAGVAHAARFGGHPELFDVPELAGWAPGLVTSAELGNAAAVRQALATDPGESVRFVGTTTALHAAAYWGQYGVVELLLGADADAIVNEPTRDSFLQSRRSPTRPPRPSAARTPGRRRPTRR